MRPVDQTKRRPGVGKAKRAAVRADGERSIEASALHRSWTDVGEEDSRDDARRAGDRDLGVVNNGELPRKLASSPSLPPPPPPQTCSISVRVWPSTAFRTWPRRKWLFLVRHGESEWNEAEDHLDVASMIEQVDHALSRRGRDQAMSLAEKVSHLVESLNDPSSSVSASAAIAALGVSQPPTVPVAAAGGAKPPPLMPRGAGAVVDEAKLNEAYAEFARADEIIVSPLTRAVQTALITMQHHPCARRKGVKLRAEAREVKNTTLGSLDTIGAARGAQVAARVHAELDALFRDDHGEDANRSDNGPSAAEEGDDVSKAGAEVAARKRRKSPLARLTRGRPRAQSAGMVAAAPSGEALAASLARVRSIAIDTNNTTDQWWDVISEGGEDVRERLNELLVQVCTPAWVCI